MVETMKYLCEVSYVGTHFHGFQAQKNKRTVQGVLTDAAARVFGVPCAITGCSRTDSGVHAKAFCLTLDPADKNLHIPTDKLPRVMAVALPPDLSIRAARLVEDGFHPRYDAKGKEYTYYFSHFPVNDPFLVDRVWQIRYPFLPDALEKMRQAAEAFCGRQDFSAFMSQGSPVKDTVRTVKSARVDLEEGIFAFRVIADGFLYNMVRIMTGTLVSVALGRLQAQKIPEIIASGIRASAGETAPPEGLYLSRVFYDEKDFAKKTR